MDPSRYGQRLCMERFHQFPCDRKAINFPIQLQAEGHVNGVYSKGNFCTAMPVSYIASQSHSKERSEEQIEIISDLRLPTVATYGWTNCWDIGDRQLDTVNTKLVCTTVRTKFFESGSHVGIIINMIIRFHRKQIQKIILFSVPSLGTTDLNGHCPYRSNYLF